MMELIRSWRILFFAKWSMAVMFIGLLTGAMAVILPPLASIGVVALVGVVLLWALPELHFVPEKLLRRMFYAMVFVLLSVPAYYALDLPGLPWVSLRRLFTASVILLFCITVAGSRQARDKIADTIATNRMLTFLTFGFFAMLVVSIITAEYKVRAFSGLFDSILTWYVPLFACILVVRTRDDVILLMKIIAIAGIINSFAGVLEFLAQRRIFFDIFPKSVLESMLAGNPALEIMYSTPQFRNGIYRASSIYFVPLSFGEFAAMAAPIGAYFVLHGESMKWRLIGFVSGVSSVAGLLVSGARGGIIAFLVAMPIMLILWTIRYSKENRGSLVGTIMATIFSLGFVAVIGLIIFSKRLQNTILGGGDTASSTDARFIQFNMAMPHILANPVTGHGKGSSAQLVGFYIPGNPIPTIDSYVITLLVEQGVPGLVLFFGMIGLGIWIGASLYTRNLDERAAVGGPIACSLIAFVVYRLVLSQTENHTLLFLIIGLVFAVAMLSRGWKRETAKYNPHSWQQPLINPKRQTFSTRLPR